MATGEIEEEQVDYEEFADTSLYPIEMRDLLNWVVPEIPDQWYEVGLLLKIKSGKLDAIKIDISLGGKPQKHFRAALQLWERGGYEPYNWCTMLKKVLCSPTIDNKLLAKEIADKLKKIASQVQKHSSEVSSTEGKILKKPVEDEGGLTAHYAVQVLKECEFRMYSNWKKVAATLGVSLDDRRRLTDSGRISDDYEEVMEKALTLWINKGGATWEQLIDAVEREEKNTARRMKHLLHAKGLIS